MEKLITLIIMVLFINGNPNSNIDKSSALEGAWEMKMPDGGPEGMRVVMTIQSPYVFVTTFDVENKKFYNAQGGSIEILGNTAFYTVEFNTIDAQDIGTKYEITTEIKGNQLMSTIDINSQPQTVTYTRIDSGNSDLAGSWRITDRMRDGEMQAMRLGARKTIKMITGTRFQWAAFNPETKQFSGTGGGTITLENGKYTEHIEFFSRNPDRVGAKLTFDYKVNGDKWEHSGLSSSGNPIMEIWTRQ